MAAVLLSALLTAPPAVQVDWERLTVRVTALAPPPLVAPNRAVARNDARARAHAEALRLLRTTVDSLRLTARETVGDRVRADVEARRRLDEALRTSRFADARYFSDGGVALDVLLQLSNALEAVVPAWMPAHTADAGAIATTGVIVDASHLDVLPALAPRLLDASGTEVLGPDNAGALGTAYAPSIDAARRLSPPWVRPLLVRAVRAVGGVDLEISTEDARAVTAAAQGKGPSRRVVVARRSAAP